MTARKRLECPGIVTLCCFPQHLTYSVRHDVGLQVVGQPARDLARHFVERFVSCAIQLKATDMAYVRWNYLLRIKVNINVPLLSHY